jgi:predicted RNA-binding Zn ribbon-like protein
MGTAPKFENPFNVDNAQFEEAAARIRELNERLIASSKAAGNTTLEAYEKSLESMLGLEEKVAGATQLDWVSAIANTHAKVVRDISAAYAKAAREMLSGVPTA